MGVERLRSLWRDNKPVCAAWLSTADGLIAEIMGNSGFDALILDMQHGMAIGPERAALWLQAVGNTDAAALVRVAWNDPVHLQSILDAGADGVVIPLVADASDAARAVGACRYPPLGFRSWGPNRASFRTRSDYLTWANEQLLCFAVIEHIDGVDQIDAIVNTPGLDGLFIGPNDLGMSMGLAPGETDERHAAACQRVVEVGRAHQKIVGIYAGGGPAEALRYIAQGYNFCPIASDVGLIRDGGTAAARQFLDG